MKYDIEKHLLPLTGAHNMRELGGYPTRDGRFTKKGCFLRGDNTNYLTQSDIDFLRGYPVVLAVDLRSAGELLKAPSLLEKVPDIHYKNVTMADEMNSNEFLGVFPDTMGEMYIDLLETSKIRFGRVFQLFTAHMHNGTCLFHCMAGKDRTGLVSMLLLELANVDDDIIIEDYAATQVFQEDLRIQQLEFLDQQGISVPERVLLSEPQNIEAALSHLRLRYGGARGYLKECGIKNDDLDSLVWHFVE